MLADKSLRKSTSNSTLPQTQNRYKKITTVQVQPQFRVKNHVGWKSNQSMLSRNICPLHTYMEECCKKFMSVLPNSTTVKLKLMNKHQNKVNSASLLYFHRTAQNILGFVYLYFLTFFLLKKTNGYLLNIAESTSEVSRTRFCFFCWWDSRSRIWMQY